MDRFSHPELRSLIEQSKGKSVSIYLPTHRVKEEAQQDPIRLKNLLRRAERQLADEGAEPAVIKEILEPAQALLDDRLFWHRQGDGLALFLRQGLMRRYRLPLRFEERVVVGNQFALQPLFPMLTGNGEFYLLALSQKAVRLFKGSRFLMEEVELKNLPDGIAEVAQHEDRQRPLQVYSGAGGRGLYFGHGDAGDIKRDALTDYFRQVNRSLKESLSGERAPLILAGVESHFAIYREVNTYPSLLEQGVAGNPDEVHPDELHHQAWEIAAPLLRREQREAVALYERLAGTGRASASLATILPAAYHGRVESLFIAVGRSLWGRFDPDSGELSLTEGPEVGSEDLVNLAALYTYMQKGAVYAVQRDQVPGEGEMAAVMRY